MLIIAAAHWAMSLSLFSSILITLNYIVRRKHFAPVSIACVLVLSFLFSFGISLLLDQWKSVPPAQITGIKLGDKGLVLSVNRNASAVVLLEGTANPLGQRVMAIPDQPLVYHNPAIAPVRANQALSAINLPPVPFTDDTPWFLRSLSIDIRLNAVMFQQKFSEGFFSYFLYSVSLIFLLCSLGYAIKFSVWPLANLFIAALAFRGILTLGAFFNTPEMQETIKSFLNNKLPVSLALPMLFISLGILVCVYSLLAFAAKRRVDDEF